MFKFIIRFTLVLRVVLSIHPPNSSEQANLLTWESCKYGDSIQNLCNKCVCTSKGTYDCEPKDCQPTGLEVYLKSQEACQPNTVYTQGSTSCICTAGGQWPHKTCLDTFRHLPEKSIKKKTCKPNGYFRVDCNICRCDAKGDIDPTRCTLNKCDEKPTFRKYNGQDTSNLFGTCLVKNWYSLAPCQFCYCMDTNKLICSTSLNTGNKEKEMALGQSSLVLCGPGLLKEIAALVPGSKAYRTSIKQAHEARDYVDVDVRAIQSAEVNSKETLGIKDKSKENDNQTFPQKEELKEEKLSLENIDNYDDEGVKNQITMQLYRDVNEKGKYLKRNPAAPADTELKSNVQSTKIRNYDPFENFEALRKFLRNSRRALKIDGEVKCEPGSATNVKCNICYCLKNGKMLCTDKKCD